MPGPDTLGDLRPPAASGPGQRSACSVSEPETPAAELPTVRPLRVGGLSPDRSRFPGVASLSRWRRKWLIRSIEKRTGAVLLCQVSNGPALAPDDALHLDRLLEGVEPGCSIGLLLDSPGGDGDAAGELVHRLRRTVSPASGGRSGRLEVIVPEAARSAATLMALGADRILMSDVSELGPMDPLWRVEEPGAAGWYSVNDYLGAYEAVGRLVGGDRRNPAFRAAFARFDPFVIEAMRDAVTRTRRTAERFLDRPGSNPAGAAAALLDRERFPSARKGIGWREARELGVEQVEYMDPRTPLWRRYRRLCRQLRAAAGDTKKVFESRRLSLVVPE